MYQFKQSSSKVTWEYLRSGKELGNGMCAFEGTYIFILHPSYRWLECCPSWGNFGQTQIVLLNL